MNTMEDNFSEQLNQEIAYLINDDLIIKLRSIGFESENIDYSYILSWFETKYNYSIMVHPEYKKDIFLGYYYDIIGLNDNTGKILSCYHDTEKYKDNYWEQSIAGIHRLIDVIKLDEIKSSNVSKTDINRI